MDGKIYGQLETLDQTENMSDVGCGVFKISRGGNTTSSLFLLSPLFLAPL